MSVPLPMHGSEIMPGEGDLQSPVNPHSLFGVGERRNYCEAMPSLHYCSSHRPRCQSASLFHKITETIQLSSENKENLFPSYAAVSVVTVPVDDALSIIPSLTTVSSFKL